MKVDILISSYGVSENELERRFNIQVPKINYKVSLQGDFNKEEKKYLRKDFFVNKVLTKGLSKNRNNSLKISDADVCVIADDDVKYSKKYFDTIKNIFKKEQDLDVGIFKIKTFSGKDYKKYASEKYKFKKKDALSVSSIEIVFRRKSILKEGIKFDENFGIGSKKYISGEENIFIKDCIEKGLKVQYFPEYIVEHEDREKEEKYIEKKFSKEKLKTFGAIGYEFYGKRILVYNIISAFKNYRLYKNESSFYYYIKYRNIGSIERFKQEGKK